MNSRSVRAGPTWTRPWVRQATPVPSWSDRRQPAAFSASTGIPMPLRSAGEALADLSERVHLVNSSFADLAVAATGAGFAQVDGILFDLGYSSTQMEASGRGFSFQRDEPLDMRFDRQGPTAADLLNDLPERELADLIYRYGEEPESRQIAQTDRRQPATSDQRPARIPHRGRRQRPRQDPSGDADLPGSAHRRKRRVERTRDGLPQAVDLLGPGGRLAVISFHSLEDRLVKTYFRRESTGCQCPPRLPVCRCGHVATIRLVHNKAISPSVAEIRGNPRARSAKMRVIERTRRQVGPLPHQSDCNLGG